MDAAEVVGREREHERLCTFVADDPRPAALFITGPPGIGKTTLWNLAVKAARERGDTVLSCRAALAEEQLSLSGLADLLHAVLPEVIDALPPPQRRALEVALLLEEANGFAPDARALGAALLSAIRELAAVRPVLVALDDVQWLDRSTASAIVFAVRRLRDEPVALLVTLRDSASSASGLADAMPAERVSRVEVSPLTVGAVHSFVSSRLGVHFTRPVLLRLHATSGGNPFYALELARALGRRQLAVRADEPLPVPPTLHELVRDRLTALPEAAREVLAIVALLLDNRLATVRRLAEEQGLEGGIDAAVGAGVLEVHADRLQFTHPLLAAGVLAALQPERRRSLHEQLVGVTGEEERALHLALATEQPAAAVAAELTAAAEAATARGAAETAARLHEHAVRLTPPGDHDQRWRRAIDAAVRHHTAGDPASAHRLLAEVVEQAPPGPLRAEAVNELAWLNFEGLSLDTGIEMVQRTLAEAAGNDLLLGEMHWRLAIKTGIRGESDASDRHGAAAIAAAERSRDDRLLAKTLMQATYRRVLRGDGIGPEAWRALEIEERAESFSGEYSVSLSLGQLMIYQDRFDEARSRLHAALRQAEEAGDEDARAQVLFHLGDLERRAGNLRVADSLAREASDLWRQGGNEQEYASSLCVVATLEALAGQLETAREAASAGLATAQRIGDETFAIHQMGVLGLISLMEDDAREASRWLEPAGEKLIAREVGEVSIYPVFQYEVDALVARGALDRAERIVHHLEHLAERTERSWTQAVAWRGRALIHAANGELEPSRMSLERAVEAHARSPQPFERARTLLTLGIVERRLKHKRRARELLDQAAVMFGALPSPPWEARARAELARVVVRAAAEALSETEARVAELAAAGMTNPEIAAAAFLSRKTVEANLTRIYRKLGVRSRVELARRLG